ncbi:MAG: YicC family protein [Spirochaetes bacterium RBG_13_68_11]|nr:MAG: YicC family protein [Spirochaetes bacterium RBG_13_68_11]
MTGMTGFGHGEHRDEKVHLVLEMRSYNNRFLELYLNLPYSLRPLEPRFRELLCSRIQRGKVELYLSMTELESEAEVHVDHARVAAYLDALKELKRLASSREQVSLLHLIGLEGVLKSESRRNPEDLWQLVLPLLERVLTELQRSRDVEGVKTGADIRRQAEVVRERVADIEAAAPRIEERVREGLRQRFHELMGEGVDEARIMAETAVQLVRCDVNEEVQRLKAHLDTLFAALDATGAQGKRLDFVCQELGREINTIGSKSTILEIDSAVITVKDALEKIREQLRNVE